MRNRDELSALEECYWEKEVFNLTDAEVYTIKDVARILKISITTAYELVRKPDFPALKVGKAIRIPKKEFEEWLATHPRKERGKPLTVRSTVLFPDGTIKPIEELTPEERRILAFNLNKRAAEALGYKVKPRKF